MEDFVQYGLAVVSVLLVVGFLKRMLIPSGKKYPPGPHGYPLLGHVPQYGAFPPKTFMKWWHRYGDVFSIRLGSWKAVGVNGYSTIKEVTNHPNDAFAGRPYFVSHEVMEEVVGASTLSSGNYCPAYIKHHQIVSRSLKLFSTGRQEVMEELVSQETNALIDKLLKNCGTIPGYVLEDVMNCFLRVTFQFLYGRGQNIDQHVQTIHDCIQEFVEFCNNGSAIDVMPWLKYFMPGKVNWLRNILGKMYRLQKEQIEEHKTDFTKEDIRDVADAFIASDVNDDNGVLSRTKLNGALVDLMAARIDWTDEIINWKPRFYDFTFRIKVPITEIWYPKLFIEKSYGGDGHIGNEDTDIAQISFRGFVQWVPDGTFSVVCEADLTYYPFDDQICHLTYYVQRESIDALELKHEDDVDLSELTENSAWEIVDITREHRIKNNNKYVDVKFHLRRRPNFVVFTLVTPLLMMASLNAGVFLVPIDSGEKGMFSITIVFSYSIYITIVSDMLPGSAAKVSFLVGFIVVLLSFSVISTLYVIIQSKLISTSNNKSAARKAFFQKLDAIIFVLFTLFIGASTFGFFGLLLDMLS